MRGIGLFVPVALLVGVGCEPPPTRSQGPALCQAIAQEYATALPAAQVCDVAASNSCGASRLRSLMDLCQCFVPVNPGRVAALDGIEARFAAQGCTGGPGCPCPLVAGQCVAGTCE